MHQFRQHLVLATTALFATAFAASANVDFYKEVYPILKDTCIGCHGPKKQKGKLRLDSQEWMMKGVKGEPIIVPGKPAESSFATRVALPKDDDDVMPPADEHEPLSKDQQELIRKWVEEGAKFGDKPADLIAEGGHGEAKKTVEEVLGAAMGVPSADAIKALTEKGALAATLAQKLNAVRIDFSLAGDKISDADVALITPLAANTVWLNLARTKITDASLQTAAKLPNLTRLHLENTAVTDAGLKSLVGLQHLGYLNLYGTAVTDAGIKQLAGLKNLKALYLWQTKVTPEGAKALQQALPDCSINIGADLTTAATPAAAPPQADANAPANKECPVSGKPVDATKFVTIEKQVAFCCEKCQAKFDANPAGCIAKIDLKAKDLNDKCPVSGKPIDKTKVSTYKQVVGFCCDKCKAKFEADPNAFIAKVK